MGFFGKVNGFNFMFIINIFIIAILFCVLYKIIEIAVKNGVKKAWNEIKKFDNYK